MKVDGKIIESKTGRKLLIFSGKKLVVGLVKYLKFCNLWLNDENGGRKRKQSLVFQI